MKMNMAYRTASSTRSDGDTIWLGQRIPTSREKTVAAVRKQFAEANRASFRKLTSQQETGHSRSSAVTREVSETFSLPARCRLGFSATTAALQRQHKVVIKVLEGSRSGAEGCVTGRAAGVRLALKDIHSTIENIRQQQQWIAPRGPFQGWARGQFRA